VIKTIEIGTPPIAVRLKKSTRARRFSLRISSVDGTVSLTMPSRASTRDAVEFAVGQERWMRKHLNKQPDRVPPQFGSSILLDGFEVPIAQGQGRSVSFDGDQLLVAGTEAQLPARLRGYFKTLARDRLVKASERYAAMVGRRFTTVTLRDTRSRWGSCTTAGGLMYSWRLVMAPRSVQDYVAAHEVCHLVEMNHSDAYWAQVAAIYPDYEPERQWLRDHGARLHQYLL
jgi:predicted metal-dependent hydrolase